MAKMAKIIMNNIDSRGSTPQPFLRRSDSRRILIDPDESTLRRKPGNNPGGVPSSPQRTINVNAVGIR